MIRNLHLVVFLAVIQLLSVACRAQVPGCPDALANNYDPSATVNDGSCTYYPISVSPVSTSILSDDLAETSGLILWDGYVWTHNDSEDTRLYGLDTVNADIMLDYDLKGVVNTDWEEISLDDEYIYLGDFGNNVSGNRTDLHLLRIEKGSLKSGSPVIDTIWFSYSDQVDFEPKEANETDFDCEALIVSEDSIYLFTKQWVSVQTSLYVLPKIPGTFTAKKRATYNIQGLITGATYLESSDLLVLCGYTSLVYPFFYLLYDFGGHDFFSGNKRRVTVSLPFHQVEGIATNDGLKYYVSNERLVVQPVANNPQKLHIFDLSEMLHEYLDLIGGQGIDRVGGIMIYPNPANNVITLKISGDQRFSTFKVIDQAARVVMEGVLPHETSNIDISHLSPGYYSVRLSEQKELNIPFLKL
ncbi:MAG: T9SS type A sorting domain-containing protein [Bacteroidales bacterium]|nr:T9SS type A sorting domain-containing protein [Bacteroidales bacterium]